MNKLRYPFIVLLLLPGYLTYPQARYFGFGDSSEQMGFQTVEYLEDQCYGAEQSEDSFSSRIIRNILSQMGLSNLNFRLRECPDMPNAMAQTFPDENGRLIAYITYGRDWLDELASDTKNWEAIGVLAHELGHIQYLHVISEQGSTPEIELQADEFMGTQLAKMGATLEEAQSCLLKAEPINGSSTHPARQVRLLTVANAWYKERDKSANELTEVTRLGNVTPQLVLDRFSKQSGGYKLLNSINTISYEVEIRQTQTLANYKSNSFEFEQRMNVNPQFSLVVDQELDESFKIVYQGSSFFGDSLLHKRPIGSKQWKLGAPKSGTGTTALEEDHHWVDKNQPRLRSLFFHLDLARKPDRIQFVRRRETFNQQECFALELPEKRIERTGVYKKSFTAISSQKNYYSTVTGLLVGSLIEEKISYAKSPKRDKEFVKEILFFDYEDFEGVKLPTRVKSKIQERNKRGEMITAGMIEQERTLKNLNVKLKDEY